MIKKAQRHRVTKGQSRKTHFRIRLCASVPAPARHSPLWRDDGGSLCAFKRGFTLIELVVAVVLLSLTAGITTHYLISASRLYALLLAQRQADSEVVDAVSRMRREARLHVQTLTADSNTWTFSNTYDTARTFSWDGADVKLNNNYLARGIDRFALSYYDATNGLLEPFPLSVTNCALIKRVALDIKAANNLAVSELKVNFFMQEDLLK